MDNKRIEQVLKNVGIEQLNEMQQAVLDAGTSRDMVLLSPTGSGKTLAFLLPLVETIRPDEKDIQVLIVAPSRELALQIETVFRSMALGVKVVCCYGGHSGTDGEKKPRTPSGCTYRYTRKDRGPSGKRQYTIG